MRDRLRCLPANDEALLSWRQKRQRVEADADLFARAKISGQRQNSNVFLPAD